MITLSKNRDYFLKDGKPFFYLADTIWSAFTNVSQEEWREYLDYRRTQGFNVLQISILPITKDASESELGILPFELGDKGKFDYTRINHDYFQRAAELLHMAVDCGFVPALAVLWLDYAPDNWGSKRDPELIMPKEFVREYAEFVAKTFAKFQPIYLISGDTDFESDKATEYYKIAMDTIKGLYPEALTTLHICGGSTELPEELIQSSNLDFYMYQSCHVQEHQEWSYLLAEQYLAKSVKRPVVNGEPCYEGHGHMGGYGRFNEFDVRKAVWQSLLSGAKAGVTYGAHGIWSWHKKHLHFMNEDFSGRPYDWRTALRLPGAWDAAFARWLFETYSLYDIKPVKAVKNDTEEIRMSVSADDSKVVVYAPFNTTIKIDRCLSGFEWILINLKDKIFARPIVKQDGDLWLIEAHDFNSDALFIGLRK